MTSPIVLPNYGAQAGQNIASLGQAIADIINPNVEFQDQLKKAVAANPDLARELAALDRDNPGFLEKLGAGKIGENIKGTAPSFSELLQGAARKGFAALPPDEQQAWATSRALGTTPTGLALEGPTAKAVGKTVKEQPDLVQGRAEQVITGQTKGQRAQESLDLTLYGLANAWLGTQNLDAQAAAGARAKIPGVFDREDMLLRAQLEASLYGARTTTDFQESLARLNQADAQRWAQNTGVGTPADWMAFLYGDPSKLDPKTVQKLTDAQNSISLEHKAVEYASTANRIAQTVDRINKTGKFAKTDITDEERSFFVSLLQRDINTLQKWGGPQLTVNYGEPPNNVPSPVQFMLPDKWLGISKRLYFTDQTGAVLTPSMAIGLLTQPPSTPNAPSPSPGGGAPDLSMLSPAARIAWSRIQGADDPQAAFAALQDQRPNLAKELTDNGIKW